MPSKSKSFLTHDENPCGLLPNQHDSDPSLGRNVPKGGGKPTLCAWVAGNRAWNLTMPTCSGHIHLEQLRCSAKMLSSPRPTAVSAEPSRSVTCQNDGAPSRFPAHTWGRFREPQVDNS